VSEVVVVDGGSQDLAQRGDRVHLEAGRGRQAIRRWRPRRYQKPRYSLHSPPYIRRARTLRSRSTSPTPARSRRSRPQSRGSSSVRGDVSSSTIWSTMPGSRCTPVCSRQSRRALANYRSSSASPETPVINRVPLRKVM
jgi:hypothetical protein